MIEDSDIHHCETHCVYRSFSMQQLLFSIVLGFIALSSPPHLVDRAFAKTQHYEFHVKYQTVSRLCSTKSIPTVNGEFPGPTVYAQEGDNVRVKVINELSDKNITIHWHGIRQLRTGWADGPGYITQCPIQPGHSYSYSFTITGQRGTLWWHAHMSWMRATVYGAIIIAPKNGTAYPFPTPAQEMLLILGEWWKASVTTVINQAIRNGGNLNLSDAYTINGQPGALYGCSAAGTVMLPVESGKTYLLRIVNAAMDGQLFVGVANHKLTVVEVDAVYTKPLETEMVLIAPGQTTNVLLKADQPDGQYYLAARPYTAPNVTLDNTTTTAIISYSGSSSSSSSSPRLPSLPLINDTASASAFSSSLRSLNSAQYPAKVPLQIDRHLFFTVGLAALPCSSSQICPKGAALAGEINNISFVLPSFALLQAHYFKTPGVFTVDFPDNPPTSSFNFTGAQPATLLASTGTRVSSVAYNSSVQLVLQGTTALTAENHPVHLHGYNFHVVGQGFGNYDKSTDPSNFNLVDPQERNTIGVPRGGWVAIRFRADNPGVWFMHCHLELHTTLGLDMAFLVHDGSTLGESIPPPPSDLPAC